MAKAQRQGTASRAVFYKEVSYGEDTSITTGITIPLSDVAALESRQDLIQVPNYVGFRKPAGVVTGNSMVEGSLPLNLEFNFLGHFLNALVGDDGTSSSAVGTGGDYKHTFIIPTTAGSVPESFQIEYGSLETTAQYIRFRGLKMGSMDFAYAQSGGATYTANMQGNGDEAYTTLDASPDDYGFNAVSYFNGYAELNSLNLVGMTDFSMSIDNGLSRQDAAFNNGIAAGINAGLINATGTLGLIMGVASGSDPEDTMNFYNYAVNQQDIPIECLYANGPITSATEWFRIRAYVRFSRRSWKAGGAAGIVITQDFQLIPSQSADWAGEAINGAVGGTTFNIQAATNDVLGIKVDGNSTNSVDLTAGGTQTAQDIVDDINAHTPWVNGASATADVWNGRIRITSDTTGASSSIQIDTAVGTSAHTELDFDGTVRSGSADTPFILELYNAQTAY